MKRTAIVYSIFTFFWLISSCDLQQEGVMDEMNTTLSTKEAASDKKRVNPVARPFKMSRSELKLEWGIVAQQEQFCTGNRIAGGSTIGKGNFTHLGLTDIEMSAAWDIDRLISDPQFVPEGPAGGPVATVLSGSEYPYHFMFNPFTQQCEPAVSATGNLVLTAANGDKLFGKVASGETHRLDFLVEGDGIENFSVIVVVGGTGKFEGATGSFVIHTISRFDPVIGGFVIDLAEVLPGGTIAY
jgi:hypothetical protein